MFSKFLPVLVFQIMIHRKWIYNIVDLWMSKMNLYQTRHYPTQKITCKNENPPNYEWGEGEKGKSNRDSPNLKGLRPRLKSN